VIYDHFRAIACFKNYLWIFFNYVATVMVEAQGCRGLLTKAGERWLMGQSPWSNNFWGPGPNRANILGKGLGGSAPGVK
jgi:hypothetical protein